MEPPRGFNQGSTGVSQGGRRAGVSERERGRQGRQHEVGAGDGKYAFVAFGFGR